MRLSMAAQGMVVHTWWLGDNQCSLFFIFAFQFPSWLHVVTSVFPRLVTPSAITFFCSGCIFKIFFDSLVSFSPFIHMDKWLRIVWMMLYWASHLAACTKAPLQPPKAVLTSTATLFCCTGYLCAALSSLQQGRFFCPDLPVCCEVMLSHVLQILLLAWTTKGDMPHSTQWHVLSISMDSMRSVSGRQRLALLSARGGSWAPAWALLRQGRRERPGQWVQLPPCTGWQLLGCHLPPSSLEMQPWKGIPISNFVVAVVFWGVSFLIFFYYLITSGEWLVARSPRLPLQTNKTRFTGPSHFFSFFFCIFFTWYVLMLIF